MRQPREKSRRRGDPMEEGVKYAKKENPGEYEGKPMKEADLEEDPNEDEEEPIKEEDPEEDPSEEVGKPIA